MNVKGVILAGGLGTRLRPLTLITNKHLLPVYDKPMILYPLNTLRKSGIKEVMVVCGREYAGHFMNFLGSGREFGVRISYAIQDKNNGGVADALSYAEDFTDEDSVAVVLGDNIFEDNFKKEVKGFKKGAIIIGKEVPDPHRYGVVVFDKKGKIIKIEEKPKRPKSNIVQTGFYIFDKNIFKIIKKLKPSKRGELEVTDATNIYIKKGLMKLIITAGFWLDAGTTDSLAEATAFIYQREK